ncbi:hypothetical protein E3V08_01230 [Candidatus Atribacteria bacterium MT.SAG.1]|nr:hypothetical protein E3V08_01230 [Candidatus Atribacteria bacterium MT.SAG.1]
MKKQSLIRTIYLYIFALLGLVLLIIGGVNSVNMGLKAFIFTQAEEEQRILYKQMPVPFSLSRVEELEKEMETDEEVCLSENEKTDIKNWLTDYNNWKESRLKIDPITARRHRDASLNLSLILIGLPLYLYHWRIIKRETREKEEDK